VNRISELGTLTVTNISSPLLILAERISYIIKMERIKDLGTTLAVTNNFLVSLLVITADVVPSLSILVTLIMEMIRSSETLVFTRATRHHVPEDCDLHFHCREYFIS
jgi:hypothetical protein